MLRIAGRWIFNATATTSILLFLASLSIPILTRGKRIAFSVGNFGLGSESGYCWIVHQSYGTKPAPGPTDDWGNHQKTLASFKFAGSNFERLEVQVREGHAGIATSRLIIWTDLNVKIWQVAVTFLLLPALWILIWLRNKKPTGREGIFCIACGYDLRATPDRCPECGTIHA